MNQGINEWIIPSSNAKAQNNIVTEFAVIGSTRIQNLQHPVQMIERHPWEAFEEVGFRCVMTPPGDEPDAPGDEIDVEAESASAENIRGEG